MLIKILRQRSNFTPTEILNVALKQFVIIDCKFLEIYFSASQVEICSIADNRKLRTQGQ